MATNVKVVASMIAETKCHPWIYDPSSYHTIWDGGYLECYTTNQTECLVFSQDISNSNYGVHMLLYKNARDIETSGDGCFKVEGSESDWQFNQIDCNTVDPSLATCTGDGE